MAAVNKCIFIGNLGRDPEIRYMPSGDAQASFSIACTESYKDKSGERKERTEWVNIVMFGKQAEIAGEYLKKGSPVYIEGRLQTRKWQDKEGVDRYTTEIRADRMQMLGTKGERNSNTGDDHQPEQRPAAPQQSSAQGSGFEDFEDDIPL